MKTIKELPFFTRVLFQISIFTLSFVLSLTIFSVFFEAYSVKGVSMEPTVGDNSSILLLKEKSMHHGQIVIFEKSDEWNSLNTTDDKILLKRIIAIPGDTISYDGRSFKVNNEEVFSTENYNCSVPTMVKTLNDDEVFVMGDNTQLSFDSRRIFCQNESVYTIPVESILAKGKILFTLPF